jgi:hypothetical protein
VEDLISEILYHDENQELLVPHVVTDATLKFYHNLASTFALLGFSMTARKLGSANHKGCSADPWLRGVRPFLACYGCAADPSAGWRHSMANLNPSVIIPSIKRNVRLRN